MKPITNAYSYPILLALVEGTSLLSGISGPLAKVSPKFIVLINPTFILLYYNKYFATAFGQTNSAVFFPRVGIRQGLRVDSLRQRVSSHFIHADIERTFLPWKTVHHKNLPELV